jgi:hypothetical protein
MRNVNRGIGRWIAALAFAGACSTAQVVEAQVLPPVTTNFSFNLPLTKLAPNPCSGGFVLLNGNAVVQISTVKSSDFKLTVKFNTDGRGEDALANGTIISDGTQKPMYLYSSTTDGDAYFPDGTPTLYSVSVPIMEQLRRDGGGTGDSFLLSTTVQLNFTNGVPTAPVLTGLSVSCS